MDWTWLLPGLGALVVTWAAVVASLLVAGRRADAAALATLIPDCVVLIARVSHDPRVPRRRRLMLLAALAYLALPFDLVPDFIPVAGQLDDAVVVALALRSVGGGGGETVIRELWPGPERFLTLVLRLAG